MNEKEESFSFVDKRRSFDDDAQGGSDEISSSSAEKKPEPADHIAEPDTGSEAEEKGEGHKAPPIDFPTFLLSLYSTAVYHMGGYQDPVSGKTSLNLEIAKQNIDIIEILESKTKGNLTEEESRLMSHSLHDLRMKYVEVSSGGKITP
jgi:hypothetical protein